MPVILSHLPWTQLNLQPCRKNVVKGTITVEEKIMEWFERRGIQQGNPEEIMSKHKNYLRVDTINKMRKLSHQESSSPSTLLNKRNAPPLKIELKIST